MKTKILESTEISTLIQKLFTSDMPEEYLTKMFTYSTEQESLCFTLIRHTMKLWTFEFSIFHKGKLSDYTLFRDY